MSDIRIGQVQWYVSEPDGGPDVGVMLRLDETSYLWAGELLNEDGPADEGIVLWKGKEKVLVMPCAYGIARELIEDHLGPIIAAARA